VNENNNNNNNAPVVEKQQAQRFDFQNAGFIEAGMGFSRHKHPYITFVDNNGVRFDELLYTNLGQFYIPYCIDRKNKSFEATYSDFNVLKFNSDDEAQQEIKKLQKGKNKKDEYIVRYEFVFKITYGLSRNIESDSDKAENITIAESDLLKSFPMIITDLIRIGFGWQSSSGTEKYKVINLYKVTGEHTYTAGIFIEDYAIYTEGAKNEQDAQSIISEWQNGKIQYKVVQGTQGIGKLSGNISEDKYTEGEMQFIRPENIVYELLLSPKSEELYKQGGYIKGKAKEMNLLNDGKEELTKEDLHKIEQLGGLWQRRVKLYRNLHKMENGGDIKKLHDDDKLQEPVKLPPTIEDEVRKYANEKNEVAESNLKLVIGSEKLDYPIHTVGSIKLKKCFLKPYYEIINIII